MVPVLGASGRSSSASRTIPRRSRDRLAASAADANGLASVIDTTTSQGAMAIAGPLARETFARFTAIDLRPQVTPVHGFRPGSVARTRGAILCEARGPLG